MPEGSARRDHGRPAERPPGNYVALPGAGALSPRELAWLVAVGAATGFASARLIDGPASLPVGIAATLAILAVVWWMRGGRGWRIDVERHIAAPADRVFAVLDDADRARDLDPRIRSSEVTEGLVRHRVRVWFREVVVELAVAEREPPTLLVVDVIAVLVRGRPARVGTQRQTTTIAAEDGGARVRLQIRGRAGSAGTRFAIGVRHPSEVRAARAMLRRLDDYASEPAREE